MAAQLVRLAKPSYTRLSRLAGRLQHRVGKRLSLNDAVEYLLAKAEGRTPAFWRALKARKKI
jgi:hypothetical protein